jgi:large subunit ribosomal protein L24
MASGEPSGRRTMKIRKGDLVEVISGKDKGARGHVLRAIPKEQRVVVEGVNQVKRHTKEVQRTRGAKSGGIITQEAPIHVSNVALLDPDDKKPTRVGYRFDDGRKIRISRRSGKEI